MFSNSGRKKALIIANTYDDSISIKNEIVKLPSCKEDVIRVKSLLIKLGFSEKHIHVRMNVSAEKYIKKILKHSKKEDLLFIHYSGHGESGGLPQKNEKVRMVSGWLNPDKTLFLSSDLENLIKNNREQPTIFFSSDACYSGRFFSDYQNDNNPIYFVSSSTGSTKAAAHSIGDQKKSGSLILLYEHIFQNNINPSFESFQQLTDEFINKYKIGKNKITVKLLK